MIKQLFITIIAFSFLTGLSIDNVHSTNVPFESRIEFHLHEIDSLKLIKPINWAKINEIQLTLSSLYRNTGEYTKAMNAALEGVRIAETYRENEGRLASYQDVANSLRYKGNFTEAHFYMRKAISGALKFKDEEKKERYLAYFYYQHTLIFQEEGIHLDSALFYNKLALHLREKQGNIRDIPQSYMSIGYIYHRLGDNKRSLKSLSIADSLHNKIKKISKPNAWLRKKNTIDNYLGIVLSSLGNHKSAIDYFKNSIQGCEIMNVKDLLLSNYKNLADCYEQLNKLDSALFYRNKFILLNDSVFNEKKSQQLEELKTVYETKEKNDIISNQTKEISSNKKKILIFIVAIVALIIVTIGVGIFARIKRLKSEKDLHVQFSQDLISNIEKDRKRISQDLHDSIGQNLLIIKNQNSLLKLKLDQKLLLEKSEKINDYAAQTIDELREISNNLVPYQLGRLGLTKAIINLIEKIENTTELKCIKHFENVDDIVAQNLQINIYRIVQESINNIIKHANASEINFEITNSKISISDNGKGFDLSEKGNGMGMSNLKNRAKLLNAKINIKSIINKGTEVALLFK